MSFEHCAELVEQADPDRFMAAMAAPPAARKVLFPLYAFNVEVTRAPWASAEPMISEMRLQFWRDVLEDIVKGRPTRAHPVAETLADVITAEHCAGLDRLVAARRWDIYKDPFEDAAHFNQYLSETGGELMWAVASCLGSSAADRDAIVSYGASVALARFFQAIPELERHGRIPLVDGRPDAVARLAQQALEVAKPKTGGKAALKEGWMRNVILGQVAKSPTRVSHGSLGTSPFGKQWRLLIA